MREIKFRAWLKYKKEMVDNARPDFFSKKLHYLRDNSAGGKDVLGVSTEDIELMQYTGLKDKNNKEIYEGDIVKIDRQLFTVSYTEEKASYMLYEIDGFVSDYLSNYNISKLEIVGNIYKNVVGNFCKNS